MGQLKHTLQLVPLFCPFGVGEEIWCGEEEVIMMSLCHGMVLWHGFGIIVWCMHAFSSLLVQFMFT